MDASSGFWGFHQRRERAVPWSLVVTRLDQAGFVGQDDGLGPVVEAEFGEQVGEVGFYRRFTEEQRAGDLLVGSAPGNESEHLQFPVSQFAESGRRP
jgi:hypothetical protein